jgi:hypothetical protein
VAVSLLPACGCHQRETVPVLSSRGRNRGRLHQLLSARGIEKGAEPLLSDRGHQGRGHVIYYQVVGASERSHSIADRVATVQLYFPQQIVPTHCCLWCIKGSDPVYRLLLQQGYLQVRRK